MSDHLSYHFGHRLDVADFEHTQPESHIVGGSFPSCPRVAKRIATKPGLITKAWRWVRCVWLRWQIRCTEDYLRECSRDGIVDSLSLRDFRRQIGEMRVQLAILEGGL